MTAGERTTQEKMYTSNEHEHDSRHSHELGRSLAVKLKRVSTQVIARWEESSKASTQVIAHCGKINQAGSQVNYSILKTDDSSTES